MKLKVSSITGIGNEFKILMVHLLSMEIILFSLLFASYCSSVFSFFFFFFKSGQNSTKFAIDYNFVTYCLNYFVSGMPFEELANSNVSSLL